MSHDWSHDWVHACHMIGHMTGYMHVTCAGGGFTSKRGVFGKAGKLNSMLSVTYGPSAELCYSGGADGRVYHWRGSTLSKAVDAHKGPVYAMQRVEKVCPCVCVCVCVFMPCRD